MLGASRRAGEPSRQALGGVHRRGHPRRWGGYHFVLDLLLSSERCIRARVEKSVLRVRGLSSDEEHPVHLYARLG